MKTLLAVCTVLAVIRAVSATSVTKLPPYIKACSRSNPNLKACALESARNAVPSLVKGDPSLHIPSMEPLRLVRVTVQQGSGPVHFSLILDDLRLYGLGSIDLRAVDFDLKNNMVEARFVVKNQDMYIQSKYKIDGQVLIMPIKGDGDFTLKLDTLNGTFKSLFDMVNQSDGLAHMKFKDSKFNFDIKKAHFDFKNLFNGDKVLGDNMNLFLNENWQDVYQEIKPTVSEVIRTTLVNILQDISSALPYDVMFPA